MKLGKTPNRSDQSQPNGGRSGQPQLPALADQGRGGGWRSRRWVFRGVALLFPLLVLGSLELGLRLAGYGYPTHYFLPGRFQGATVLVENPKFGWRFFPPSLARRPDPLMLALRKPAGTYRIFVMGESAAQGHPDPSFSFARILQVLLEGRYPDTKFEVINTSMTAINSHVIRAIAEDCAGLDGDLWVVYMGHNEVVGPFGAGTVFGPRAPVRALIRGSLALKTTRVGQLLDAAIRGITSKSRMTSSWRGLEMFADQQLAFDDPRMAVLYQHFLSNLDDIIQTAHRAGAKLVLCTTASNLKDCAPFRSLHRAGLSASDLSQWEQRFKGGIQSEAAGRWTEAVEAYRATAQLDSQFAELQYRWGRCCLRLSLNDEARQHLALARDYDALKLRADSRLNQVVRQTAANSSARGMRLLDASEDLAHAGADGLSGENFFYEHVHLTFEGNYQLARLLANQVAEILPAGIANAGRSGNWPSSDDCALRLAWTPWDQFRIGSEMAGWLRTAPFTNQLDHLDREQRWEQRLAAGREATSSEGLHRSAQIYRAAVARTPGDWRLRQNASQFLERAGDLDHALEQCTEAARLLPPNSRFLVRLANVLGRKGESRKAETAFLEALALEPDSAEALNGLGLARAHQGRYAEAVPAYLKALKLRPDLVEAHMNLGLTWLALGNAAGAVAEHEMALKLDPENVAARINLGKLRQAQGDFAGAVAELTEAVRLEPGNAFAHYNLAKALGDLERGEESVQHFTEAARLRPDAPDIHLAYGLELARQGRLLEATAAVSTAIRLDAEDPETHFLLGRLLLDQGRRDEGVKELKENAAPGLQPPRRRRPPLTH